MLSPLISTNSFLKYWWSKNPAIWLVLYHFATRLFPERKLSENHKQHCNVPFLGLKKDTSNDRIFGKCQKTLFLRNLGVFPYFIEKFGFLRFWWLRASNLMWNLRKILSAVLEKNVLTDILTYWKRHPHALFAGGRDPKITHKWRRWTISPETSK